MALRANLLSVDDVLQTLPDAPAATTRGRGWGGITVDVHAGLRDCAVRSPAHDHHLIGYCPSGSARLVQGRAGERHAGVVSAGMSLLMPAGVDSTWEGDAPASVRLRVPHALLATAAEQLGARPRDCELRNVFETRDAAIGRIACILADELQRPAHPAQRLVFESLSCALAAHLAHRYNALAAPGLAEGPRFGSAELAKITTFVEDNLERPIDLVRLAAIVNVSRFHFTRLFKRSTGVTAMRFVEASRIRRAKALIDASDAPLAEVALLTGFADQSHFTRRFHLHVGCTPAAYAREGGRRSRRQSAVGAGT